MAIDPSAKYPGQIVTADANYPYGKARNVVSEGDGTGTPFEEDLVNDVFGFQQALLQEVSVAPSGTPDHANTSQYRDALKTLTRRTVASFDLSGSAVADNGLFTFASDVASAPADYQIQDVAGTPADPGVQVMSLQTSNPLHIVMLSASLFSAGTSNPFFATLQLEDTANTYEFGGARWSASAGDPFPCAASWACTLSSAGAKRLKLRNTSGFDLTITGKLVLVRVGSSVAGW